MVNFDFDIGFRCFGNFLMTYLIKYVFQDLTFSISNIVTEINQSKTLTKHISCECRCKFDGRKCNSNQKCNNNKC